jgi:hypothetical protein
MRARLLNLYPVCLLDLLSETNLLTTVLLIKK